MPVRQTNARNSLMPQEALFVQAVVQYGILINYTILKFMNVYLTSSDSAD